MQEFFSDIFRTVSSMSVFDFIDIGLVSVLFYFLYKFMRDRRSGRLAIGLALLVVLEFISDLLDMYLVQYILENVFRVGLIAVAVIFQPELRSALEKVGGQPFRSLKSIGDVRDESVELMVKNVASAVSDLSASKTGALIAIERLTRLGDLILTGTVIDSATSPFLIKNIFFNKAPLHDGAVIIRGRRLHAAGCLLPLSQNDDIVKELGTRHRAAIGLSENSDAVVIVVSEETGTISLAVEGILYRGYNRESLEEELMRLVANSGASTQKYGFIKKLFAKKNDNTEKEEDTVE